MLIVIIQSKSQRLVIDINFIISYSTVKMDRVSDQYQFYYNLCDIEQQNLHIMLLYIKLLSVVWEHVVSDHGAAIDLNREFLGIFLFLFVYINFMSSFS